ncbi:MAG: hypothetical protein FJ118_10295 [Deltaproteobacteria bacterium]|nr:hypothetical protein [Deltaproteobacteria bacterium]
MKRFILILLALMILASPPPSNAFPVLKWAWDGVANAFGLDRGPVPKVVPKRHPADCDEYTKKIPKHTYRPNFHIQAEGF